MAAPGSNQIASVRTAATAFSFDAATNTLTVTANQAQYADLAEIYAPDQDYQTGTVVVFGGPNEITVTDVSHDSRVAGVISTNPGYIMNCNAQGLAVALTGRTLCRVRGPVKKGDILVTSNQPGVAQILEAALYVPGCVIGKSLEDHQDDYIKSIEVVVGRF